MKFSLWCAALALGCALPCFGHIGYTGRDFGTLVNNATPTTIAGQKVKGGHGWADGTDADLGDSHKLRFFRFTLQARARVSVTVTASDNGSPATVRADLKPAFSIYRGLAHLPPISTAAGGSADHDSSAISLAWRATLGPPSPEGCFKALGDWRIGGDNQTGPSFDFDAADGLSRFVYVAHRADGDSSLFGTAAVIEGDNSLDGSVNHGLYLDAGDYTLAVGGADYDAAGDSSAEQDFGLVVTLQAQDFAHSTVDPADGGVGYSHQVLLTPDSYGEFSDHVGAWSWEDNALFGGVGQGVEPVGWTHTSRWLALRLTSAQYVTLSMERDASVPWPSQDAPDRLADTQAMFPSLTLWRGWDNDGEDSHTYNNRGAVSWAEDLRYLDHIDNRSDARISRTWFLPAGDYSVALGSNAPATNSNRQGFKLQIRAQEGSRPSLGDPSADGIDYTHLLEIRRGLSGELFTTVGAQSWWDPNLFAAPPASLGDTTKTRWVGLMVKESVTLSFSLRRDPSAIADKLFPSFTLWRGWDNDGPTQQSYPNKGAVPWAEDLVYMDHGDNAQSPVLTRSYTLSPGCYTLALGGQSAVASDQPQNLLMQYQTSTPAFLAPQILGHPRSVDAISGSRATFSVRASGPDLSYEWLHNGEPIANANTAELRIAAVAPQDAGSFECVVRNSAGIARTQAALLRVIEKPVLAAFDLPDLVLGQVVSLQLRANPPATNYSASGLPRGLSLDRSSGLISGRPLELRSTVTITATASNAAGSGPSRSDSFAVNAPAAGLTQRFVATLPRSIALNQLLGGRLQIEVNSLGSLSGSLTLGAAPALRFTSPLPTEATNPQVSISLPRQGNSSLLLNLTFNPGQSSLNATLSDASDSLPFTAKAAALSAVRQNLIGNYTMALKVGSFHVNKPWVPQGHSVAALTLGPQGNCNAVLLLADGSRLTLGGDLLGGGEVPWFAPLYRGSGSLSGTLSFADASGDLADSQLSWFKAAKAGELFHAEGFGPMDLESVGRRYLTPAADALPLGFAGENNARLRFDQGNLWALHPNHPNCSVTLTATGATAHSSNGSAVSLSVDKGRVAAFRAGSSGSFRGGFKLRDMDLSVTPPRALTRQVSFQGMLVDDGSGLKGYGFFILPQMPEPGRRQTLSNTPRLSGSVMLEPSPL